MSDPPSPLHPIARSLVRAAVPALAIVGAFALVPLRGDRWWLGALIALVLLASVVPIAVRRLRGVLASDHPMIEAVEALILLLTMLAIGFATLYFVMNRNSVQIRGLDTRIDALYFAVTTLSTVGFGDVVAVSQAARLVVTIQIVVNLAFVGLAVRVFTTAARIRHDQRTTQVDA